MVVYSGQNDLASFDRVYTELAEVLRMTGGDCFVITLLAMNDVDFGFPQNGTSEPACRQTGPE